MYLDIFSLLNNLFYILIIGLKPIDLKMERMMIFMLNFDFTLLILIYQTMINLVFLFSSMHPKEASELMLKLILFLESFVISIIVQLLHICSL
jgi:hypothetical protein